MRYKCLKNKCFVGFFITSLRVMYHTLYFVCTSVFDLTRIKFVIKSKRMWKSCDTVHFGFHWDLEYKTKMTGELLLF